MRNDSSSKPPQRSSRLETMRTVANYSTLGIALAFTVGLGAWGGYKLDAHFGTEPWLLLLGAVLGITVGLYHFLATVLRK